jgi:glutamyl-tRNA synthetase
MPKENKNSIKFDEKLIKAYTLKNALAHEGKANPGAVISALFHEGLKREEVKSIMSQINKIVKEINFYNLEKQAAEFEKLKKLVDKREEREGLPELPNVDKKKGVIMRFSPSPSGPMHIGHAATGMPSSLYVKKYGGKFYFRIEDTNPENIDPIAYKMLPEEADWLFGNVHEYYIQSDKIDIYYDYAKKLIEKNAAYVCTCDSEEFKKLIERQKACPCRNLSIKENLERWNRMFDKKGCKEGESVLRFKSDLNDPNPAMRDFPLARIKDEKHPRQGKKYRVWPLMNLCVSVDDMIYEVTHVIRGKDHRDNAKRQAMIFKVFSKKVPETFFLGKYQFTDLELSCSQTRKLIEEGKFSGWDDIRLPFIAAIRRRGYQSGAFEKMAIQRGLSEVDKLISREDYFELLDNFNREIIKDIAKTAQISEIKTDETPDEIKIRMPDNCIEKKFSEMKGVKVGEIIYFYGFGYCKLNKEGKNKEFWFCHR